MKAFVVFVCSALAIATAIGCRSDPPLEVARVELSRLEGRWYEIAKLPRPTQRGCEDTTAYYRIKSDSEIDVVNECMRDGALSRVTAKAVVTDPDVPGKLAIDVGAFFGDYWIIDVGEDDARQDYESLVIGHPTRDYLWILSRTPSLPEPSLRGILERAEARQFDVSRLEYTKQSARPEGEAAAPPPEVAPREYGCAFARTSTTPAGKIVLLGMSLMGILTRRRASARR
jgi:apolipoprotein D and lipocalin family protein